MSIPNASWRTILVSRATRESAFGGGATVDRRLLVRAPTVRPKVYAPRALPVLEGPDSAKSSSGAWYEADWTWDAIRPDDLAWALSYALGPATYVTLDTTAKRHSIVPDTAWTLPSFSAEEIVATGWHDRYTGGIVRSLRLAQQPDRSPYQIEMNASLLFRTRTTGSGNGSPIAGEPVWPLDRSKLWIGSAYAGTTLLGQANVASATDCTTRWLGFTASFDNGVTLEHALDLGGGTVARPERGTRDYGLRTSLEMSDSTLLDDLSDGAMHALEIGWASGVLAGATSQEFGLHLIWPRVILGEVTPRDGADGRLTAAVTWHILGDPTYGAFIALVWNQTAPYAG